jgi:hypothetical protein
MRIECQWERLKGILCHVQRGATQRTSWILYRIRNKDFREVNADRASEGRDVCCCGNCRDFHFKKFEVGGCSGTWRTYWSGGILAWKTRRRYFSIQVAPQLYSRGWVDPVPDPLLLRKSDSVGNLTRDIWICSQELWPLDHRGGLVYTHN